MSTIATARRMRRLISQVLLLAMCATLILPSAGFAEDPPPPVGTITGRIVNSAGEGIDDIWVQGKKPTGEIDEFGDPLYSYVTTLTLSDGYYTIEGVTPGDDWEIDFMDADQWQDIGDASRPTVKYRDEGYDNYFGGDEEVRTLVSVTADQTTTVDATLTANARITGSVRTEAGEYLDTGTGVIYKYQEWDEGYGEWQAYAYPNVLTEDYGILTRGDFEWFGEPGVYKVGAADNNYGYLPQYLGPESTYVSSLSDASAVTVEEMTNFSAGTFNLSAAATIEGTVTKPDGTPAENVYVDAYGLANDDGDQYLKSVSGYGGVSTDESGTYTISLSAEAALADVGVRFSGEGYSKVWYGQTKLYTASTKLSGAESTSGIDAVIEPSGSISGKVTDAAGKPLANVAVSLISTQTDELEGFYFDDAYTSETGSYTVYAVDTGNYKVKFWDESQRFVRQWYNNKSTEESADLVAVSYHETDTAKLDRTGINAKLALTGAIAGLVKDASTGKGIPYAYVTWSQYINDYDGWDEVSSTHADASGRYVLYGAKTGYGTGLRVWASGYASGYLGAAPGMERGPFFPTLGSGSVYGKDFSLAKAASIEGTVSNAPDGAVLYIYRKIGTDYMYEGYAETWNETGRYLFSELAPGTYKIYCSASGCVSQYYGGGSSWDDGTDIVVAAGQVKSGVNITMAAAASIAGTLSVDPGAWLTDVSGQVELPPVRYEVGAVNLSTGETSWVWEDDIEDGVYTLSGLPAGDYKLAFKGWSGGDFLEPSYHFATQYYNGTTFDNAETVTVGTGQSVDQNNAMLVAGETFNGTIDSSNTVKASVSMQLDDDSPLSSMFSKYTWAASPGEFQITGLTPGDYTLSVYPYDPENEDSGGLAPYYYNGGTGAIDWSQGTTLTVSQIVDAAEPPLAVVLQKAATLSVKLLGVGGAGIGPSRGRLMIWGQTPGGLVEIQDYFVANGTTGKAVANLVPGAYKFQVKDELGAYRSGWYKTSTSNATTHTLATTLTIGAGQSVPATFTLSHLGYTKTKLSMSMSTSAPNYGSYSVLYPRVSDVNGWGFPKKSVKIYRSTSSRGPWTYIKTSTTGTYGLASGYSVKSSGLTYYRAVYADPAGKTISTIISVKPKVYVSLSAPSTVKRNVAFGVYGYLKPRHSSGSSAIKVSIQKYNAGTESYAYYKTVTMKVYNYSSYSKYTGKLTLPSGKYRLVSSHADSLHSSSSSSSRYVTSK